MPVPDDLLRHVVGPTPYSSWAPWLALVLVAILVGWYVGVIVFTSRARRLRDVPLVGAARDRLIRHRFARAVNEIGGRYRAGELEAGRAGAAISHELRRFLHRVSGVPAEYMQLDDIAQSEIAAASQVLEELTDVQFNAASQFDVGQISDDAGELIRSWT
jgi:signal transduction histidine kinase